MRNTFILLFLAIAISSCEKENSPTPSIDHRLGKIYFESQKISANAEALTYYHVLDEKNIQIVESVTDRWLPSVICPRTDELNRIFSRGIHTINENGFQYDPYKEEVILWDSLQEVSSFPSIPLPEASGEWEGTWLRSEPYMDGQKLSGSGNIIVVYDGIGNFAENSSFQTKVIFTGSICPEVLVVKPEWIRIENNSPKTLYELELLSMEELYELIK